MTDLTDEEIISRISDLSYQAGLAQSNRTRYLNNKLFIPLIEELGKRNGYFNA